MLDSHSKLTLKRAEESARIILFQEQIENKKLLGIPYNAQTSTDVDLQTPNNCSVTGNMPGPVHHKAVLVRPENNAIFHDSRSDVAQCPMP
jgi:hypothetical protein